jgi:hypothetical protein
MPTYRVTDPETGLKIKLTGNAPPSKQTIDQAFISVRESVYQSDVPTLSSSGEIIKRPVVDNSTFTEKAVGVGETVRSAVSGATKGAVGYLKGTIQGIGEEIATGRFGEGIAEEAALKGAETHTYAPETEKGKEYTQALGKTLSPAQALMAVTPQLQALNTSFVYQSLKPLRKGTRLIDPNGQPTQALRKALDRKGLVYENLTPEAKSAIPEVVTPKLLARAKKEIAKPANKALVQQIKSGGTDDSLAVLKVVGDQVKPDKLGAEAVKQGFEPGFVQGVKTASPGTKRVMNKMLVDMERITKNRSLAQDFRPTDRVGDVVLTRVNYIKGKANNARARLDQIANQELRGKPLSNAQIDGITGKLSDSLRKIDVALDYSEPGKPKPVYKGSMISKDRTSQRIINDLIDVMSEGGRPDALRLHKLKRQLDTMIDFRKKSAGGLTDAGKNVLKEIRYELNQTLRNSNKSYAETNDVLSSSLTSLDDFSKALGPSIDMFGEQANKAIGTDLRGLLSNRKTRIKLDNALNQLDDTAKELGGKFDVNYKDLTTFANGIEDRFGAIAQTSLKGEMESAIKAGRRVPEQGVKGTLFEFAADKATEGLDKARGINDFNAFKSMRDLLKD